MALLIAAIGILVFAAAGCGGDDEEAVEELAPADTAAAGGEPAPAEPAPAEPAGDLPPVEALPSSSCAELESGGDAEPQLLIVSDLPRQGSSKFQTDQMVEGMRYLLEQNGWKAGDYSLAYQDCDDSTAQAAKWDPGKCSQNAQAYAQNPSVIVNIGTFNSGCAAIEIPILNQAPGGALAMISPANTYVCLTEGGPGCDASEPDKYYPTGERNYARVVAHDAYQGAAAAEFLQAQGVTSCYILNDKEAYGLGVATNFRNASEALGIEIAGFEAWDPRASNYEAQFSKIGNTDADCIFLGGLIDENGAQLIKDKVSVLGPNDGDVKLFGPDGFATQSTVDEAGEAAAGMYLSVAGIPIDEFTGPAEEFIAAFSETIAGENVDPYTIYAVQALQIALDAIASSDGTRAAVLENIYNTVVENGYLGNFEINENGDPTPAEGAVVGFTIFTASAEAYDAEAVVVEPSSENVEAARG